MKKIFSIICLIIIFGSIFQYNVFAKEETKSSYSFEYEYKLYKVRTYDICNEYKYINKEEKNGKITFLLEEKNIKDYLKLTKNITYSLPDIKNRHKTNMNNIYKCALLNIQKKSFLLIKNDLINKSPSIAKKVSWKIDRKIGTINNFINSLGCTHSKDKSSIQKLNVLAQTTYQTCKYVSYLEYLKEYNNKIDNIIPDNKETITINEVSEMRQLKINEINEEIEHTYKIFPLAFHAYTEYENNITIHFLLELLKDDYLVLREKIHKALNPINQLVYKVANAMKK